MKKANKYKVCQVSLSRKIIGRHSLLPVLHLHGKSMQSHLPRPLSQVCIINNFLRESMQYLPAVSAERK